MSGDDEAFVADFEMPEGLMLPPSYRQHVMMVGTARTAVRSPQVNRNNHGYEYEQLWSMLWLEIRVLCFRPSTEIEAASECAL